MQIEYTESLVNTFLFSKWQFKKCGKKKEQVQNMWH